MQQQQPRNQLPIRDKNLCYWYKSTSIEKSNPYYEHCRYKCNGYNEQCKKYLSQETLEKKVMTELGK